MKKSEKEFWGITLFCFLFVVVASNAFAYFYVTKSRFIYSWDNTLFWSAAKSLSEYKIDYEYFKMLYASFGNSEYNMLPVILPSLVMKLFGTSRLVFIISIINLYFMPTVALIFIISRRHFKFSGVSASFIVLAFPVMIFTGLIGFLDVGAVFLALLSVWFYTDFEKHYNLRCVCIGVLLVVAMLFRRYFAFFSLSFVISAVGENLLFNKKKMGVVLMITVVGAILFIFLRDFMVNQLLKDYGNIYSDYKFSPKTDFKLLTRYFGIVPLFLIFSMPLAGAFKNKMTGIWFLLIQIVLCFVLFINTQTHGQQHLLLYVPSLLMLVFYSVVYIKSIYAKRFLAVFSVLIFLNTFVPRIQPVSILEIKHYALIPDFSMLPKVREDVAEILKLKRYLNKTVENGKKVGILASSLEFNEDIVRNCEASLGEEETREDFILNLPCVDSKDRDLSPFFDVDYMVVAFPVQTHLGETRQQLTVKSCECFLDNKSIAKAFFKMSEVFEISDMDVHIYKKERTITDAEKREFYALFS